MYFDKTNFDSKFSIIDVKTIEFLGRKITIKNILNVKPIVYVNVNSFAGYGIAHHIYASLSVPRLICETVSVNKEFNITVKYPAPKTFRKDNAISCWKGELTGRFNTIDELITAVEEHFNTFFGEPWELQSIENKYTFEKETWEESKTKLRKIYGDIR